MGLDSLLLPTIGQVLYKVRNLFRKNTMKAKMKCSNCGAELENFNMNAGIKQFWVVLPILLIGFFPLAKLTFFKSVVSDDLSISSVEVQTKGSSLEITGLITNSSNNEWSGVSVEAEFFDNSGKFVDEASHYLRSDILGKAKEHFKITIRNPPQAALNGEIQPKLKLSGGHTSSF